MLDSLGDSKYLRDLKINVGSQHLAADESRLLALSIAVNEKHQPLIEAFSAAALEAGATNTEVAETLACASLLSTNNIYYRFRHFVDKDVYTNAQAGIRMSIMMAPVLGKEFLNS